MYRQLVVNNDRFFEAIVLICLVGSFAFGQGPGVETPKPPITNENYRIGPGDVLDVTVSKNETLSRSGLKVSNLGTIQLPMMDADMPAACLTERGLADAVKDRYRKYLVDPFVNVSVREFNSSAVAVIGAVNSPGRFQLQRPIRLVELLTFVNGISAAAGKTATIIRTARRPYCDGVKLVIPAEGNEDLISVNLADALKGNEEDNPLVIAGDIIKVDTADQSNAYIQGNVYHSLAIDLKEPVTLTQAIAMAGGPAPGAEMAKVMIRRQIPGSINREAIVANVKEINLGKKDDVLLQRNDIIDVPGATGAKRVFQNIYKTMIPMVTQLPMRAIY